MIPEVIREHARSEIVEALRLNLIQLPEGVRQTLSAKPFGGPVQYGVGVMIVSLALAVLIYIYRQCAAKREGNARKSIR